MLLLSVAFAGGFFHPDEVAGRSHQFALVADAQAQPFAASTSSARELSVALQDYRTGLALLGDGATEEEWKALRALESTYNRQFQDLSHFMNTLITDTEVVFVASLERAVLAIDSTAVECEGRVAVGPRVPGMPGRSKVNSSCKGEDYNQKIANYLDKDAELVSEVAKLTQRTWPKLSLPTTPSTAVGEGPWVNISSFFRGGPTKGALIVIARQDDEAREEIEAKLEQGAAASSVAKEAKAISEATNKKYAALSKPFFEAIKESGPMSLCARPLVLGGCEDEAATADQIVALWQAKKVKKVVKKTLN